MNWCGCFGFLCVHNVARTNSSRDYWMCVHCWMCVLCWMCVHAAVKIFTCWTYVFTVLWWQTPIIGCLCSLVGRKHLLLEAWVTSVLTNFSYQMFVFADVTNSDCWTRCNYKIRLLDFCVHLWSDKLRFLNVCDHSVEGNTLQ